MRAQQVLALCMLACLACIVLAARDDDYDKHKPSYSHSPHHTKEYKKEKEEYEKEYKDHEKEDKYSEYSGKNKEYDEKPHYGEYKEDEYSEGKDAYSGDKDSYGYGEDDGYKGPEFYRDENYGDYGNPRDYKSDPDYLPRNPDGSPHLLCQDYHSWPEEWENWLCLDLTKKGRMYIKQVNTSSSECKAANGTNGFFCTPKWPGTDQSCYFKVAPADLKCRHPRGPCEKNAYCPGPGYINPAVGPICPTFFKNGTHCRTADPRNPCDQDDFCNGKNYTCPTTWVAENTTCAIVNATAFPCQLNSTCNKAGVCTKQWKAKDAAKPCRALNASQPCDVAELCPGDGSTGGLCPADGKVKKSAQLVCNSIANNSCILGGVCDGKSGDCPAVKDAPDGTPCRKDGLYQEAVTSSGSVALKGHYPDAHAKAHGWTTCNRCYEGQCQEFKWEFWGGGDGKGDYGGDYKEHHKGGEYKDVDKDDYSYAKYPSKTVYKKKSSKYYSKSHNKHSSYKKQYHKAGHKDHDYDYHKSPPSPPPKPPSPPPPKPPTPPPPKPTPPPPPPPSKKYDKYDKDSGKYDEDSGKYDDDKYSGYDKYDDDIKYDDDKYGDEDEYYYKEYYPTKIFETSDKVALQNYGYHGGSPIEPELYCVPYKKDD